MQPAIAQRRHRFLDRCGDVAGSTSSLSPLRMSSTQQRSLPCASSGGFGLTMRNETPSHVHCSPAMHCDAGIFSRSGSPDSRIERRECLRDGCRAAGVIAVAVADDEAIETIDAQRVHRGHDGGFAEIETGWITRTGVVDERVIATCGRSSRGPGRRRESTARNAPSASGARTGISSGRKAGCRRRAQERRAVAASRTSRRWRARTRATSVRRNTTTRRACATWFRAATTIRRVRNRSPAAIGNPTAGQNVPISAPNVPSGKTKKQITGTAMRLASGAISELWPKNQMPSGSRPMVATPCERIMSRQ